MDFDNLRKFICFQLMHGNNHETYEKLNKGELIGGLKPCNLEEASDIFKLLTDENYEYVTDIILSCAIEDNDIGFTHDSHSKLIYPMVFDHVALSIIMRICFVCKISINTRMKIEGYPELVFETRKEN